jgi:uncharacterized lipoprotein YddW (UPF0748 family)
MPYSSNRLFKTRLLKPLVLLAIALFATLRLAQPPAVLSQSSEIRGVWLTTHDTEVWMDRPELENAMFQLAQVNFNTVYPVMWNSGYTNFPSPTAQKYGFQPFLPQGKQGYDILAEITTQAHRQGLLVLPWFEFGFMAPPTSELVTQHPEWLTCQREGTLESKSAAGEVVWLNPFLPVVQQLIRDLVMEVVEGYDIDGIQFDDHLSLPREFGYDPYTLALYQKETKKTAPADFKDPDWVKWRADKISAFVAQLNQTIKARKPQLIFSVSPNSYDQAYRLSLQDWLGWVRQGWVDEIVVQNYRPDLDGFSKHLVEPALQETRQKIPTAVGILTGVRHRTTSMDMIQDKIEAARHNGLGVSFFFYESLWDVAPESPQERRSRFRALFPTPAQRYIGQVSL